MDLFDCARALENQVVWVASNQYGAVGDLRFAASTEVVDPSGEILARTGQREGLTTAALDVEDAVDAARAGMHFLRDRRPDTYSAPDGEPSEVA